MAMRRFSQSTKDGDGAVCPEDKALGRLGAHGAHFRADFIRRAVEDDFLAFHPTHEGPPEQARHLFVLTGPPVRSRLQFTHLTRVTGEAGHVRIGQVVIADVQDVERAGAVDLLHQGQIEWAHALVEDIPVAKTPKFTSLGGGIKTIQAKPDGLG